MTDISDLPAGEPCDSQTAILHVSSRESITVNQGDRVIAKDSTGQETFQYWPAKEMSDKNFVVERGGTVELWSASITRN